MNNTENVFSQKTIFDNAQVLIKTEYIEKFDFPVDEVTVTKRFINKFEGIGYKNNSPLPTTFTLPYEAIGAVYYPNGVRTPSQLAESEKELIPKANAKFQSLAEKIFVARLSSGEKLNASQVKSSAKIAISGAKAFLKELERALEISSKANG